MLSRRPFFLRILLSAFFCLLLSPPVPAKPLHYLYINAREGSASGGHTAISFNNETFHFQHYDGGTIRLVKQISDDFDFHYRYLENRTINQATIELDDAHYDQLRKFFNLSLILQKQQDDLLKEINLNLSLLAPPLSSSKIYIRGAGLLTQNPVPLNAEAITINNLQQHIKQKYGDNFLTKQILSLQEKINTLQPRPWPTDSLHLSDNAFLAVPYSFASQHLDAVSKMLFLQMLQQGASLDKQHYFTPEQANFKLSTPELEKLRRFQHTLENNLLNLINSQRTNWGNVAFILYARILSLSIAIDSGTLVFLNSYAPDSFSIPYTEVESYKEMFQAQKARALTKIIQEKRLLFTRQQAISENHYSLLEQLSNYYHERDRGLANKLSIRIYGEQLLPTTPVSLPLPLYPQLTSQKTEQALQQLHQYKNQVTQQMQSIYHYDLITRNCVTEIFDTIRKSNISGKPIKELGKLAQNNFIAFIPFGSFRSLANDYSKQTRPSFRQQQLNEMYQQENNALVYLRESNTLSARYYKFNDQDSIFLFFTDHNVLSRPLLGAFNLLTAMAMSLYGSFSLPFDAGYNLQKGSMGILMSLPELAFFNIRKGSYKHLVPPVSK